MVVPLGLRIQRVRTDERMECISSTFQGFSNDSDIVLGVRSHRDSTTNGGAGKSRAYDRYHCKVLTQGRQLPPQLVCRNVLRTSPKRSPDAALHGITPYFKMHDKRADMTDQPDIGARAFVHVAVHVTKTRDKA